MHIVMLKKYFIEIDLCVIDSYIKDAFFKYVILHQNCVYTAVSIIHISITLSFIIIIIFVLKNIWCYIYKTICFFFSWQITCCISGNWYSMSNDCHIYWWEFNYLKSIKSRIFKEWSHLIFSKRFFWKISKPCRKIFCHLLTDDERWFWFTVDSCFLMSYNGLVYYPVFKWWLRSSDLFNRFNLTQLLCHED